LPALNMPGVRRFGASLDPGALAPQSRFCVTLMERSPRSALAPQQALPSGTQPFDKK